MYPRYVEQPIHLGFGGVYFNLGELHLEQLYIALSMITFDKENDSVYRTRDYTEELFKRNGC